ncbi:MAG: DUF6745 domain-containing protein [Candidatus Methylacidiphilales bacterium]
MSIFYAKQPIPGIMTRDEQDKLDEGLSTRILLDKAEPDTPVEGARLKLNRLNLHPDKLPRQLACRELILADSTLEKLPEGWSVSSRLDLTDCTHLRELPRGLKVATLILRGCINLPALPADLDVHFLDASGCRSLVYWPESARVTNGFVNLSGAERIERLPRLGPISYLSVAGCTRLKELPEGIEVNSWVDIADSGVTALPQSLQGAPLRWRGVAVDEQLVFHPETLDISTILKDTNIERRRIALDRVGREKLFSHPSARILDTDTDPGGQRRLLQIPLHGDEPMVLVSVNCPSTARHYLIRVPPTMKTCRQAIAWTAGFDNPDDYQPLIET